MGDKPRPGVRIRSGSSIEIDFYYRGVQCRERIKLPPTPRNLNYAANLKARVEHEIAKGEFDYKKHFPDSHRVKLFSTLPGDMAGESPMWVAKPMGHTDWSLTAKRYARWISSDMPDAGKKMTAAWSHSGHNEG